MLLARSLPIIAEFQAKDTTRHRAGKGKMRNRRWKHKLGPLIVYGNDNGIAKAFRNLPGMMVLLFFVTPSIMTLSMHC